MWQLHFTAFQIFFNIMALTIHVAIYKYVYSTYTLFMWVLTLAAFTRTIAANMWAFNQICAVLYELMLR